MGEWRKGSRTRFRIWSRKTCGFESHLSYNLKYINMSIGLTLIILLVLRRISNGLSTLSESLGTYDLNVFAISIKLIYIVLLIILIIKTWTIII